MDWTKLLEPGSISSTTSLFPWALLVVVLTSLCLLYVIPLLFSFCSCMWMTLSSQAALPLFCTTSYIFFPLNFLWKTSVISITFWGCKSCGLLICAFLLSQNIFKFFLVNFRFPNLSMSAHHFVLGLLYRLLMETYVLSNPTEYRSMVRALQYLTMTRSDKSYAVNLVS